MHHSPAIILSAIFLLTTACQPAAYLNIIPDPCVLGINERISRSSLIVVGVAVSEIALRSKYDNPSDVEHLQLRKVNILVEGVVKGNYKGRQLTFLYYGGTDAYSGPARNNLGPEQRAIFYLKNDAGNLRTTNDVYLSHTGLVTGKHKIQPAFDDEGVRELIAHLMLLPGEDLDLSQYLDSLHIEAYRAVDLVGKARTGDLLLTLLENQKLQIRRRACLLLAEPPFAKKDCLSSLIQDIGTPAEDRKLAIEMMGSPTP